MKTKKLIKFLIKNAKVNYFVIPLIVLTISFLGSQVTSRGLDWYEGLRFPEWVPSGAFIGTVWSVIYILTVIAVLIVWNTFEESKKFYWIIGLFIFNAFLNALWSFLFFGFNLILGAFIEMIFLEATIIALIVLAYKTNWKVSLLLLPYALWVAFASFLTLKIFLLNS